MAQQPGFLHAEVTRDAADAKTLLVFHAWTQLEDWQAFQTSQWKIDFMAGRPEGLYNPVPVGMNWTLVAGEEGASGRFIRRKFSETDLSGVLGPALQRGRQRRLVPGALDGAGARGEGVGW